MMPEQALMKMLIHTASDSCWDTRMQRFSARVSPGSGVQVLGRRLAM